MDTPDELRAEAAHLKRIRDDLQYAIQCRGQEVYSDLREFESFLNDHDLLPKIAYSLNRALCNVPMASLPGGSHQGSEVRNNRILRARLAVVDAMADLKQIIDNAITDSVERGR